MSLPIPLSRSAGKLVVFYLIVGWIYYDITIGQQESVAVQQIVQEHRIKFKNVEYEYILKAGATNCDDKTLLIAITSPPDAAKQRNAIRNTWLKNLNSTTIYRFFIGFSLNDDVAKNVFHEAQTYGDIISTGVFDSSETIVFKTYAVLKWQQVYCTSPKYILRVEDDIIVDTSRLLYWIENEFDHSFNEFDGKVIFCKTREIIDGSIPYKTKWSNKNGVEYCESSAYLLSTKAANLMLKQVPNENMVSSFEDIMFTGVLAEATKVQRYHKSKHFSSKAIHMKCGCDKNGIPNLISVAEISKENSTTMPLSYDDQVNQFLDKSCGNGSDVTNVEYFKHCIAHTG